MLKKSLTTLLTMLLLALPCTAFTAEKPITLVLAHSATPDNSLSLAYNKFAELCKEKSGGKLIINVVGGGALAGDQTAVDGCKLGILDMGSSATNNMASYTTAFWVTDLPYIFKDIESSHKVWWGPVGEELKAKAGKDIGLRVLFFIDTGGGFRLLANNQKVVKVPADTKSLKLRATGSAIELATFKQWGAAATPIAWPEVYTALEQKVIDGESLHPVWLYNARHHEALKYLTKMNAFSNTHACLMSNKAWNKLTPELRKVIEEAGRETQEFGAAEDAKLGQANLDMMLKAGLELYVPTPEEEALWRESSMKVWADFHDKIPQDLIERVLKAQE